MEHTLKFCLLASGSGGNATIVEYGPTRLLIDAGLSAKRLTERAAAAGYHFDEFTAIVLSHEHGDHISAAGTLARRYALPVYASNGTLRAGAPILDKAPVTCPFAVGEAFHLGDIAVHPYRTPHDVADGCAFVFDTPSGRLGWAMDLGSVTTLVRTRLRGCHALILEFNHDERLVREGTRPWPVKQRILGDHGHLSNEAAAALLADVDHPDLHTVVVAHISRDHNHPSRPLELIEQVCNRRPRSRPLHVTVASQDAPTARFEVCAQSHHAFER